MYIVVVVVIVW